MRPNRCHEPALIALRSCAHRLLVAVLLLVVALRDLQVFAVALDAFPA